MNYTYLAIAGAVILIFLSVYFFTAEKMSSPFKGCEFVSPNHKGCPKKGQQFVRYRSSLTAPKPDQVNIRDFETLCCDTVEQAMAATKDLQITSMMQNLNTINGRLGLKSTISSEIN